MDTLCKDEATARPAKQERQKRTRFCRSSAFMPDQFGILHLPTCLS